MVLDLLNTQSKRNQLSTKFDERENLASGGTRTEQSREAVILIHGLGSNQILMMPLAFRLRKQGFRANTFGYSSFFKSIQQHAEKFDRRLKQLEASESIDRWHIVAHSMGSIITRHLLCHRSYDKLGRVVMLGPPNAGSAAARRLSRLLPYSQTVRQISDDQESFVRGMPSPTDIEIGVVAASYDRVVTECSSRLQTQRDHVTVYSGHNGLLVRRSAARQVISFLRTGQFVRADG